MSYSSHGEDRVLLGLLERMQALPDDPTEGWFVDVGAYHPRVASNSALFYDLGWNVTAVEPNPFMAAAWREQAPRALVLEQAVTPKGEASELLIFNDWASSNTLNPQFAKTIAQQQKIAPAEPRSVQGTTLQAVFDATAASGPIQVLNVDVEGVDLEVLATGDWERWRPILVCVEDLEIDLLRPEASVINRFMTRQRYHLVSQAGLSSVYVDLSFPRAARLHWTNFS